ncbi:hypothetical protein M23134_02747 [Microscilla marina ATCC 23134]|uniref:Uncharacterized protein n=1 Tax=Microscilla marina ATCC 23134 TaxID=313606 RepID=A1ZWD7_MICM2|nr:hypothetical protein M23134_02747 [Microscilla marina ATCC 23134]
MSYDRVEPLLTGDYHICEREKSYTKSRKAKSERLYEAQKS